ncbi:MAG TPA: YcxB family protein [Candidatus Latescibacteria bacterium]|nr:YcxB family protein [Candidatus Latescibacterota bacterium]HOS66065.1 YcxB family protein [Candidatus Latescibacterota bacterium]
MLRGVRAHFHTATQEKWLLPLSSIVLFTIFGRKAWRDPSDLKNYAFLLLGILSVTLPLWRLLLVKRNIRRMPNFGKTINWTMDETGLRGRGEGFDFSQDWSTIYSATITRDGFLVYPQKQMFYWLPSSGFTKREDVETAEGLITQHVKRTKMVQHAVVGYGS